LLTRFKAPTLCFSFKRIGVTLQQAISGKFNKLLEKVIVAGIAYRLTGERARDASFFLPTPNYADRRADGRSAGMLML